MSSVDPELLAKFRTATGGGRVPAEVLWEKPQSPSD